MLPGNLDRPCRGGGTIVDARQRFWLVDSKGLITRSRADADSLPDHVLPYCHRGPSHPDLKSAVAALKPSVLIGISENSQAITFCQDVCQRLATAHDRPIIMPLSLPGGALWSYPDSLEGMSMQQKGIERNGRDFVIVQPGLRSCIMRGPATLADAACLQRRAGGEGRGCV